MLRLAFLLVAAGSLLAAEDAHIASGFDHFYNLEYDQALTDFQQAQKVHPNEAGIHNNIAQTLLYQEMYRDGALESELVSGNNAFLRREKLNPSPQVQKQFDDEINQAISLAKSRLDKNAKDTGALYTLGVSYAIRSNYNFLVRKSWHDALSDATQARKLHDKVIELDPKNYDARLIPGLHEYIVGSLPWTYRALGFLAGFHGDKEGGIQKLEEVSRLGKEDRLDADVLLCAIYRREGKRKSAIPLLNELIKNYPRNYLFLFEKAQMYAALGNKAEAIGAVEQIANLKGTGMFANVPWEKIYYEEGNIQFWYNDFDHAMKNLKKATAAAKDLDLNSGVLAYMRQGQIYDLQNHHDLAKQAYEQAITFAPESDAAKESRRYLSTPYRRTKS